MMDVYVNSIFKKLVKDSYVAWRARQIQVPALQSLELTSPFRP